MRDVQALPAPSLRRRCDPASFSFGTTADLPDVPGIIGQERAEEAVRFAIGIRRYGYNLYALGTSGMGKHGFVRAFLERQAAGREGAPRLVLRPRLRRPAAAPRAAPAAGPGAAARARTCGGSSTSCTPRSPPCSRARTTGRGRSSSRGSFTSGARRPSPRSRRRPASAASRSSRRRPGSAWRPLRDGEVIDPEEFQKLPAREQERIKAEMAAVQQELQDAVADAAARGAAAARRAAQARPAGDRVRHGPPHRRGAGPLGGRAGGARAPRRDPEGRRGQRRGLPAAPEGASAVKALLGGRGGDETAGRRYEVNVLVTQPSASGAPVVYEDHPTHANLVGRVEHVAELGNLVTDFTLVQAGALHRANGGYLIVDARRLLLQPLAWDELKRALRSRVIRIESVGQALSLNATASLEPEPIPLEVKVVLLGERHLYYLLSQLDPEFPELFKVAADFEEEIERTAEGEQLYARLLGTFARREGLRPLDPGAVARAIEQASRRAADVGEAAGPRRDGGRPPARGRPPRRRGGGGGGDGGPRAGGARRPGAAGEPRARAHPGGHPPGHAPRRHPRRGGRPGERARRSCSSAATRSAGRAGSRRASRLGQRERRGHREGGGARRADPLEGRPHPRRLPRPALRLRAAALARGEPRLRAVVLGCRGRQRLLRGARGAPLGARRACRCARAGRSPAR